MNKKLLLSLAVAGGLTVAASVAQAGAVATSYLHIADFKMTNDAGEKLVVGQDLTFVNTVTNNGDTNAELNGASDEHTASGPASAAGLLVESSDVNNPGYVDDSFTHIFQPADASATYSVGDALLTGAIVDFPGLVTPDADAQTLAEVSIVGDGNGSAAGNNVGVQGKFEFVAGYTGGVNLSFNADAYVRALLTSNLQGVSSDASISWSINIIDVSGGGVAILQYAPLALNTGRSVTDPGDDFLYELDPTFFTTSFAITEGAEYQITIDHASDANAEAIPEPAPLALMSLGLIGLAWKKRRDSK